VPISVSTMRVTTRAYLGTAESRGVDAALRQQILVRTALHKPSGNHHQNLVRSHDRGQGMGHRHCCPARHQVLEGPLDAPFGVRIGRGCASYRRLPCVAPATGDSACSPNIPYRAIPLPCSTEGCSMESVAGTADGWIAWVTV